MMFKSDYKPISSAKKNPLLSGLLCLLTLGLLLFCLLALGADRAAAAAREELESSLLRLHVIAASDSEEDQALKLLVRDAVLEAAEDWLTEARDAADAKAILSDHLTELRSLSKAVLQKAGCGHTVTVTLETCEFPVKLYGSLTFPAGTYDALRVEIGPSQGKNWWCVLYPPLCFLDAADARFSQSSLEILEGSLSEHALGSLTGEALTPLRYGKELAEGLWSGKVPVKFWLWEWAKGWWK